MSHCSVVYAGSRAQHLYIDDHAAARPVRMVSPHKTVFYCTLVSVAVGAMLVVQYWVLNAKTDDVREAPGSQIAKWLASITASAETIKLLKSTVASLEVTAHACAVSNL